MATNTFVNTGDNLFKTAANWSTGTVPATGDGNDLHITDAHVCNFNNANETTYTLGAERTLTLGDAATFSITALAPVFTFEAGCIVTFANAPGTGSISIYRDITLGGQWNCDSDGSSLTVDGALTLAAGASFSNFTPAITLDGAAGPHNVTNNITVAANQPKLIVNAAGTTYTATKANTWKAFTLSAGTYAGGAYDHTINGSFLTANGGVLTSTGDWTRTGTGNVYFVPNARPYRWIENGTATLITSACYCWRLAGSGTIGGAQQLIFYTITANDFWTFTGTFSATNILYLSTNADISNAAKIVAPSVSIFRVRGVTLDRTLTLTGGLDAGSAALEIYNGTVDKYAKLAMAGGPLTAKGAVTLGSGTTNLNGILDCNGSIVNIGSLAGVNAANLLNEVVLGSCYMQLSGAFNGALIPTITATPGACHIEGRGAGSVINCAAVPGGAVHCHNLSAFSGNHAAYTRDQHAPPGSMAMMGVGI